MRSGKWFSYGGIFGIFLILLFTAVSCSDNNIINPPSDNNGLVQDIAAINAVELAKSGGLGKSDTATYLIAQTQYGFEINGSAMTTSFVIGGSTISISVPANNFDKSRWGDRLYIFIRAEKWNTANGIVYYYDCTPEGVVFSSPLKLTQPFTNSSVGGTEYLYWKNANGVWVVSDTQTLRVPSAKFSISHFSKYAISD
ncbi:MAG: hypothetical protein GX409_04045 [candidate division Zixibacteria bacterium]|nr:hypothetical protein [candidate division Zixibacteria bacterium]